MELSPFVKETRERLLAMPDGLEAEMVGLLIAHGWLLLSAKERVGHAAG